MEQPVHTPRVFAKGRWWPSDEIDGMARRLHQSTVRALPQPPELVAVVVPGSVEGVAVVLAVSALAAPVVLLPRDPRAWRTNPPIPPGTPFVLSPACADLAPEVERLGYRACLVDEGSADAAPPIVLLRSAGMVWFTSGSTGLPRPVFRTRASILACVDQRLATLPLGPGTGVVTADSLAHGQGFIEFLLSCRLDGAFAPLEPLNLRTTLGVLAMPEFGIWFTTPHVAAVVSRCPLDGTPAVPPLCFVAGAASSRTAEAFTRRFGRGLRQHYGSSEGGPVSLENAEEAEIRRDTVGRLVRGVEVRIGDDPATPFPNSTTGRIWIRSAGQMAGYGFPPHLDTSNFVDGWSPTRDLGSLGDDGYLTLAGRIDDCIRIRDGRLINLSVIAVRLREAGGVTDAVALPIDSAEGLTFGAVVEGTGPLDEVRQHLSAELPPWSWPRDLVAVPALPRLANGKVDRQACGRLLSPAPP